MFDIDFGLFYINQYKYNSLLSVPPAPELLGKGKIDLKMVAFIMYWDVTIH